MSSFIAICTNPNCKAAFEVNNFIHMPEGGQIYVQDSGVFCVVCNHPANFINGTYQFKGELAELIMGTSESLETYRRIKELLKLAGTSDSKKKEDILKEVESISPETAKVFKDLIADLSFKDAVSLLLELITAVILIYSTFFKEDSTIQAKDQFIQHLLDENKELKFENKKINAEYQAVLKEYSNIGPKQKCPCKSGKRFKKCHGKVR